MPPADKDGKKTGPASPLDDFQMGADEFDWDKAIDEWDPTFIAESAALPPEISGVVVAQPPEPGLPLPPGPAAALKEAAAALPAPLPPLEGEAAPLPPPPPLVLEPPPALQIDIDLTKTPLPTDNVDATLSLSAAGSAFGSVFAPGDVLRIAIIASADGFTVRPPAVLTGNGSPSSRSSASSSSILLASFLR